MANASHELFLPLRFMLIRFLLHSIFIIRILFVPHRHSPFKQPQTNQPTNHPTKKRARNERTNERLFIWLEGQYFGRCFVFCVCRSATLCTKKAGKQTAHGKKCKYLNLCEGWSLAVGATIEQREHSPFFFFTSSFAFHEFIRSDLYVGLPKSLPI